MIDWLGDEEGDIVILRSAKEPSEDTRPPFRIKNKSSNCEPKDTHYAVKTFIESLQNEIDTLPESSRSNKRNLAKEETKALKDLSER